MSKEFKILNNIPITVISQVKFRVYTDEGRCDSATAFAGGKLREKLAPVSMTPPKFMQILRLNIVTDHFSLFKINIQIKLFNERTDFCFFN